MRRIRLELLAAMGLLSGCGKLTLIGGGGDDTAQPPDDTALLDDTGSEPRSCDEAPVLTRETALGLGWEEDSWLVCAGDGQDCEDPAEMASWEFLSEALGEHPDPEFCGWYGTFECGPEEAITDQCCYLMTVGQMCEGRPLIINGERRRVVLADGPWARATADEHASVASFARHILQLMALGAPSELLAGVARAMSDEIRHATLCAEIAGVELAPLPATEAVEADPRAVLCSLIREACINETIAAAIAAEASTRASGREREILHQLARDEQRHSTLAWKTLAWMLRRFPELRSEAVREFARPVQVGDESAYGHLTGEEKLKLADTVMRQVVYPCAASLLNEASPDRTDEASPTLVN